MNADRCIFFSMIDAGTLEMPFMATLPKSEKSKLARTWDLLKHMAEVQASEGQLIPVMLAAKCLGYTRSSVDDAVNLGKLRRVDIDGHPFITQASLVAFAKMERRRGRPPKVGSPTFSETVKMAREMASKI